MSRMNMRELGRQLGVDRATVSRALSDDKAHLVAPGTRERIRAAAARAGYQPDLTAATLRRGRSRTIGIISADLLNEVLVRVVRETIAYLNRDAPPGAGITPLIAETRDRPEEMTHLLRSLLARRVDAIITLASTEGDTAALLEAARDVPVILAVRSLSTAAFPSAVCDDEAAGAMVASYLESRGHRVVCQIQGPQRAATFKNRASGFARQCAASGLLEYPASVATLAATSSEGKRVADAIVLASPRPTAVFAHNDALALGVIEAMRQRGLRYPDDIAIVGFNNTELSRVLAVPLTTVDYPIRQVSQHAGELVEALVADRASAWRAGVFTAELVRRASA